MSKKFPHNLIKGKIAEIVFEQMFRESKEFMLLRFGYEYTEEVIAQYRDALNEEGKQVLKNFSNSPDFLLLSDDKKDNKSLYLVEVKYKSEIKDNWINEIASDLSNKWHPCWLFVASTDGFFFDSCHNIKKLGGKIKPLDESWVNLETQQKYHELLLDFEKHSEHFLEGD